MHDRITRSTSALAMLTIFILVITADPGDAQMVPLEDRRELWARAESGGESQHSVVLIQNPFDPMIDGWAHAYVESGPPEEGNAEADAFQSSTFFPAAAYAGGGTSGRVHRTGRYEASSLAAFVFRLDYTVEFTLDATVIPSVEDPQAIGIVDLQAVPPHAPGFPYQRVQDGTLNATFRLSPGRYVLRGWSFPWRVDLEFVDGPVYEFTLFCQGVQNPSIVNQPADVTAPAGGNAVFSVTTPESRSILTFQWRRNGEPLADGGRISGASTSTLSIHEVAHADSGYYDVVVNDGLIDEYSSLARLTVTEVQGIATEPAGSIASLRLGEAAPNPFRTATMLDYTAPAATPVTISIYDAAGRSVRQLGEQVLSGPGSVTWDGRTAAGARAPAGTYFLRLVPEQGAEQVRRLTLLR
jgi:hypothetical protein